MSRNRMHRDYEFRHLHEGSSLIGTVTWRRDDRFAMQDGFADCITVGYACPNRVFRDKVRALKTQLVSMVGRVKFPPEEIFSRKAGRIEAIRNLFEPPRQRVLTKAQFETLITGGTRDTMLVIALKNALPFETT